MTDELWTPSDELLTRDPIANANLKHPGPPLGYQPVGDEDDAANEAAAATVLAEAREGQPSTEDGHAPDDDEIDDPDDPEPVPDDT